MFLVFITGCNNKLDSKIINLENKVESLTNENSNLLARIENLNQQIHDLQNPIDINDNSKCKFIRTLRIISKLDYQTQDNQSKLLAVDMFQGNFPVIISTTLNIDDLKEKEYYEFTFEGYKRNYHDEFDLKNFNILKITTTTKTGLNQINEKCS